MKRAACAVVLAFSALAAHAQAEYVWTFSWGGDMALPASTAAEFCALPIGSLVHGEWTLADCSYTSDYAVSYTVQPPGEGVDQYQYTATCAACNPNPAPALDWNNPAHVLQVLLFTGFVLLFGNGIQVGKGF